MPGKRTRFSLRENTTFTAQSFCNTISSIIYTGLSASLPNYIQISMVNLETDMSRENWDNPTYVLQSKRANHTVVRLVDTRTGDRIIVDGSYGQIDHRQQGRFLIISEADFPAYYKTSAGKAPDLETVPENEVRASFVASYDIPPLTLSDVSQLVDIITP